MMPESTPQPYPQLAHVPQLGTSAALLDLTVYYRDGTRQNLRAIFRGPWLMATDELYVAVNIPHSKEGARTGFYNEAVLLDPLCVVVEEHSGRVLWNPRAVDSFPKLNRVMRDTLNSIPHWPAMLELGTSEIESVK